MAKKPKTADETAEILAAVTGQNTQATMPMVNATETHDMQPVENVNMDPHPKDSNPNVDLPKFNDDVRDAIFAKRRQIMINESGGQFEPTPEPITDRPAEEVPAPQSAEQAAEGLTPPSEAESVVSTSPAAPTAGSEITQPQKYTLLVNGSPIECTQEELVTLAQKGFGAERKFEEAARMRQETLDAQRLMFSNLNQNSQGQPSNNQAQAPLADIPEAELRDIAKRLNYGSEEDQIKALRDAGTAIAKATGRPQGPSPEQLINAAAQQSVAIMTMQQAQDVIKSEFKDILADPPLAQATDFMVNQLVQKYAALGQQKSMVELFREAGTQAREKYLRPATQSSGQTNSTAPNAPIVADMSNKIVRKAAAPKPPNAASKVSTADTNVPQVTPASIVAQMRKSRGQQAY